MGNGVVFEKVKAMLPVSGDAYDQEIILQIKACALDLTKTSEFVMPGTISISRSDQGVITDNSTVTDELVITAIAIWCNMRIGNPPNYDQLRTAYEGMKGSLRLSSAYNGTEVTTA